MEAPHKHRWILYAAIAGVVIIGGIIYYIESNKPKKNKALTTPIPPVTPSQAASSFPIQYGASGQIVKNLQNGLSQYENVNISITGAFDAQTLTALQTAGFSAPVSQSDYDEIIAPADASNTASTTTWNQADGDLPTTGAQASAVLLDPNATSAQISAAEAINATILGGGTPGTATF